ncbi:MAG: twin-arginine translocation signal domain-containing protein [Vicinamibacterales bacterium]
MKTDPHSAGPPPITRRNFLKLSASAGAVAATAATMEASAATSAAVDRAGGDDPPATGEQRAFAAPYRGRHLDRVAFPLSAASARA